MHFAVICRDKSGALQTRMDNRAAHLAYLDASGVVELAGPFLDEGGNSTGSLLLIDVNDRQAAEDWAANDPYAKAGLFESVSVQAFKKVVG